MEIDNKQQVIEDTTSEQAKPIDVMKVKVPKSISNVLDLLTNHTFARHKLYAIVDGPVVKRTLAALRRSIEERNAEIDAFCARHKAILIQDPDTAYRSPGLCLARKTKAKNHPGWKRVSPDRIVLVRSTLQGKEIVRDWQASVRKPVDMESEVLQALQTQWLEPEFPLPSSSTVTIAKDNSFVALLMPVYEYDPADLHQYNLGRRIYQIDINQRLEDACRAEHLLRDSFDQSRLKGVRVREVPSYEAIKRLAKAEQNMLKILERKDRVRNASI